MRVAADERILDSHETGEPAVRATIPDTASDGDHQGAAVSSAMTDTDDRTATARTWTVNDLFLQHGAGHNPHRGPVTSPPHHVHLDVHLKWMWTTVDRVSQLRREVGR